MATPTLPAYSDVLRKELATFTDKTLVVELQVSWDEAMELFDQGDRDGCQRTLRWMDGVRAELRRRQREDQMAERATGATPEQIEAATRAAYEHDYPPTGRNVPYERLAADITRGYRKSPSCPPSPPPARPTTGSSPPTGWRGWRAGTPTPRLRTVTTRRKSPTPT